MIKDFKRRKIVSPRFFKLRKDLERGKIVSPRLLKLKKDLERASVFLENSLFFLLFLVGGIYLKHLFAYTLSIIYQRMGDHE